MSVPINYWAVLVAALFNMVLGAIWFGPLLGKQWAAAADMTADRMREAQQKGMSLSYALMFVGSLLMAYVLVHSLIFANAYLGTSGALSGLLVGLWTWVGFVLPVTIGVVLWDGKPWKYWIITYSYNLVGFLGMGVILALWS